MTVYKRGGVYWYAFIRKGVRIQQSSGTKNKRTAEEIEAAHKTRLARIAAGIEDPTPAKAVPLLAAAIKDFLEWSKTIHADKTETTRRYKTSCVALLEYFGKKILSAIESSDVENFVKWRSKQKVKAPAMVRKKNPKALTDKPIQPATINRELACLRAMFNYFIGKGFKINNPVSETYFLEENEDTFYILSYDEEAKYLAQCSQPLHDVAVIILETGMRPEEVYLMRWKNLHADNGFYKNPKGKTKAARRRIELSQRAITILQERRAEAEEAGDVGPWIFPSPRKAGTPLVKLNGAHAGALTRSKLPRFRIYDLRHTFATRMVEAKAVDLITLMHMLGHRRLDMVLKYAHPSDSHKRDAIDKFEKYRNAIQLPAESADQE